MHRTIIWVVAEADRVFIGSVNGETARWYREYLNDLEMLGLITTVESGRGMRGHTRLIRPGYSACLSAMLVGVETHER